MKYKKTIGAMLAKNDGKFYIIKGRELFNINEVGARIFDLCDSKNTSEEIIKKLSDFYEGDKEEKANEINSFLSGLVDLELIKEVR